MVGELLYASSTGLVVVVEHGRLERWTPRAECLDNSFCLRLDDEMDVRRAVRPEAHIYLGRLREPPNHAAGSVKQRTHLGRLVRVQVRHPHHMTRRLDQKGPHSKRSDTVLNPPVLGLMDEATRKIAASAR